MTVSPRPDDSQSRFTQLAAQLSSLGAETPTERNVKQVLPWVISIAIHIGVALVAALITWTVANQPKQEEGILIVADFNAMNYEPVASIVTSDEPVETAPEILDFSSLLPTPNELLAHSQAAADMSNLFSPTAAADQRGLGNFAPAADGNSVTFAGTSATNARRIVYAIDATGTMIAHFQIVIDELSRSLSNLSPQQSFAIIFFQGDLAVEVPPVGRLAPATAAERVRALKWIRANMIPKEATNPIVAIEKALRLKPDVIFMLSHGITGFGKYEIDQRDLLARLDELNPLVAATGRRAAQINCIQFIDEDPLDTMKLIAQTHGGPNGYKFLSRRELGLGGP